MNWIDNNNRVDEGIIVGGCKINRLLFANDLELLASSSDKGLHHELDRFSTVCNQA